jgi:hypothetical protein
MGENGMAIRMSSGVLLGIVGRDSGLRARRERLPLGGRVREIPIRCNAARRCAPSA